MYYIALGVLAAIVIIRGIIWEERKEKLYTRIEALEKTVEDIKKKVVDKP